MNKRKICFIVALLITGGSDKLLLAQSSILIKNGFDITIYSIRPIDTNSLYTEFIKKGINIKDYPKWFKYFLKMIKYALIYPVYIALILFNIIGFNKIEIIEKLTNLYENGIIPRICEPILFFRILIDNRREKYEIISASHFITLRIVYPLKKILKIRVFYTEISSPKWQRRNLTKKKFGNQLNFLDKIIVPSDVIGKELMQYEGLRKKYVVLPFFIEGLVGDTRFINRKVESFGSIARLSSEKNQDVLIKVLKLIKEKKINIKLVLIGKGPKENYYRNLAEKLEVSNNVKFISYFKDINDVIDYIDIFLLCSDTEGMSLSLVEALYFGKPIIATDVGANSELVINGYNGFLVDKSNTRDIAEKIISIMDNDDLFRDFSENSRKLYDKKFNPEILSKQLLEIYKR